MPQKPIVPGGTQIVMFYGLHDQGFTFTFYLQSQDYALAIAKMQAVNTVLLNGTSDQVKTLWGRVSLTDVRGDAVIVPGPSFNTTEGASINVPQEAAAAIMLRFFNATTAHWWNHYWHGFPAAWMLPDGKINFADADYQTWRDALRTETNGLIGFPTVKGALINTRVIEFTTGMDAIRILSHKVGRPFGVSAGRAA